MNEYRIYPSLLDSYMYMIEAEGQEDFEQRKADLLAKINRVPQEPSMYATRGTVLNELVDMIIEHREQRDDMTVQKDVNGNYVATLDGFEFHYEGGLPWSLANSLDGYMAQVFCKAPIDTPLGRVELYGYADYVGMDDVVDLKTTKAYTPGNYREHWQHLVYPYCLMASGDVERIDKFTYLVCELNTARDGITRGTVYTEDYEIRMEDITRRLVDFLQFQFLPFLEDNRSLITDMRIFNK